MAVFNLKCTLIEIAKKQCNNFCCIKQSSDSVEASLDAAVVFFSPNLSYLCKASSLL